MKILAAHNPGGDIEHVVVLPPDAPPAVVGPTNGNLLTEIETPDVQVDLKKADGLEKLVDVVRGYRVDLKARAPLKKK